MFFRIQITTKNKNSLNLFLTALIKLKTSNRLIKCSSKQNLKKFVTVLKSPHVNKSAQEQFEYRIFSKTLFLYSSQPIKDLLALKTIKNSSFSSVRWKIAIERNCDKIFKCSLQKLNPDNSQLKLTKFSLHPQKSQRYIQLFDSYGELVLKKFQIVSNFN